MRTWSPTSWQSFPNAAEVAYDDPGALTASVAKLRSLPPLVNSWEVDQLKAGLAEAEQGRRFVLQGGDCAETVDDCTSNVITNKLKILLQMSLVLVQGTRKGVIRIGRIAGQYAKPRSSPTETRGGVTLPSYFGDLYNRPEFEAAARRPDPAHMVSGYQHAGLTLNFIRSLSEGGFADLHHPENWDLAFVNHDSLPSHLRQQYRHITERVADALRFIEALTQTAIADLSRVEVFTSHEGLNLHYESAQTRTVPRREGYFDLCTHLPWIGERTRQLDGAHVEFFRGIENPIGIKLGPSTTVEQALRLSERLNPRNERGKLVLITRMGHGRVRDKLPTLVEGLRAEGRNGLWMCDPMHGNTQTTSSGLKTRDFDHVLGELEASFDVHHALGTHLGGVHFELTGDDVTECVGPGVSEADLDLRYASVCDPRLNYRQALEMSLRITHRMLAGNERAAIK